MPGPSNGVKLSDREIAARYNIKKLTPARPASHSPPAPHGPSRLAIANEQAAATGGYDEGGAAAVAGEEEPAATSPDAKGGNCAIM